MLLTRPSRPDDQSAQRTLWTLAFGDSTEYIDNFYLNYYTPERVLVLEEDGLIRSMTAWFDTSFVLPGQGEYKAAYLYAVATHPDCQGRGLAAKLLADADVWFAARGLSAVTTVPAEPSLHSFFGRNGFGQCFTMHEQVLRPEAGSLSPAPPLIPLSPKEYGELRERLLQAIPHIAYPADALGYQAGICRLSGGGLYQGGTPDAPACLCAEPDGTGRVYIKELLCQPTARQDVLNQLSSTLPASEWVLRTPGQERHFGLLKWLDPAANTSWSWQTRGYLGLAFD